MRKFPHIFLFRNVLAYVEHVNTDPEVPEQYRIKDPVTFQGTIKLHGSNCGVAWDRVDNTLQAQSKEIALTPRGGDYKGFAAFVEEREDAIRRLIQTLDLFGFYAGVTLYGEWVGAGVVHNNKGSAVGQLEDKVWVLYSIITVDNDGVEHDLSHKLNAVDDLAWAAEHRIYSIRMAGTWYLAIDFNDPESVAAGLVEAQKVTDSIENECPFGKVIGVQGRGEGIVWMPQGEFQGRDDLKWKLKTPEHSQVDKKETKERVVDQGLELRVGDFLDQVLTEARLERGIDALGEAGQPVGMKSTRHYLQWVAEDVQRECVLELEDAELEWEQVVKMLNARALVFFKKTVQGK